MNSACRVSETRRVHQRSAMHLMRTNRPVAPLSFRRRRSSPKAAMFIRTRNGRTGRCNRDPSRRFPRFRSHSDAAWPRIPIDAFVLSRLKQAELASVARGRPRDAHPPPALRSDRAAADARGGRAVCRATRRPTPTSGWSIGCWPARTTAKRGASTGSTWSATPRRRASNTTGTAPAPGGFATTSFAASTPTSRSTGSCSSSSPATSCRAPSRCTTRRRHRRRLPPPRPGPPQRRQPRRRLQPQRGADRDDRRRRHGVPRPDGRLRPLPRPQVRADPAARLLPPAGLPGRDARARRSARRRRRRSSGGTPRTTSIQAEIKRLQRAARRRRRAKSARSCRRSSRQPGSELPPPLPTISSVANDAAKRTAIHVLKRGQTEKPKAIVGPRPLGVLLTAERRRAARPTSQSPTTLLAHWLDRSRPSADGPRLRQSPLAVPLRPGPRRHAQRLRRQRRRAQPPGAARLSGQRTGRRRLARASASTG